MAARAPFVSLVLRDSSIGKGRRNRGLSDAKLPKLHKDV